MVWLKELSFFTRRGAVCVWEDHNFYGWSRGAVFSVDQRGDQNFLRVKEGEPKFLSWELNGGGGDKGL